MEECLAQYPLPEGMQEQNQLALANEAHAEATAASGGAWDPYAAAGIPPPPPLDPFTSTWRGARKGRGQTRAKSAGPIASSAHCGSLSLSRV